MFKRLADALLAQANATCALTCELGKMREQREREIQCHAGLATLEDLRQTERRILAAIQAEQMDALNTLTANGRRITRKMEALDAQTPAV